MITTLALPPGFTDPNVTDTAPVWTDGTTDYRVASGLLEEPLDGEGNPIPYVATEPVTAQPDRVNVVLGMDGLGALAAMGLAPKADDA